MTPQEVLEEIVQGFSEISDGVYFKHPSLASRLALSKIESDIEKRGRELGLLNKEESLAVAIKKGLWGEDLEEEISQSSWYLERLKRNLSKVSDFSLKKELESSIEREKQRVSELSKRKREIQGICLEEYVATKLPATLSVRELFTNRGLSDPIDESKAKNTLFSYLERNSNLLDRDLLLRAAYLPSFFDLFFIYESIDNIFAKSIYELTIFQKELLGYGRVLHSKLTRISNIPEVVKNDPIKLYSFEEKDANKKEEVETNVRKLMEEKGGVENLKPEDKLT